MRIFSYFRLIRPLYLVGIALVFLSTRYGIISPEFTHSSFADPLSFSSFLYLLLATLLVGAGGFMINDYFDRAADAVLRSRGVIVGVHLSRRTVIATHIALTTLAFFLALIPSLRVGRISLVILFPLAAGLLWFYSTLYKHRLLVGNFILALLAFALPFLLLIFEVQAVNRLLWRQVALEEFSLVAMYRYVLCYALVLSFSVFVYTLIKNFRSFSAGVSLGSNSIAVRYGLRGGKVIVAVLLVLFSVLIFALGVYLFFLRFDAHRPVFSLLYAVVGVVLPLIIVLIMLLLSERERHFRTVLFCYRIVLFAVIVYPLIRILLL